MSFRTTVGLATAALALAVGPVGSAAAFSGRTAAPTPGTSYGELLAAVNRDEVAAATFDEASHTATVTLTSGRQARVAYPAADASLPVRMARHGIDVSVVHPYSGSLLVVALMIG